MWFVWEYHATGKYTPCIYADEPAKASYGSHTPKRKGLTKLKPDEHDLSLDVLARIYPLLGDNISDIE